MAKSRQAQRCPVARTLDVVGDTWAMLIIRDLRGGAKRFVDLSRSIRGISPTVLSARLKRLTSAGVVERQMYSEHPPRAEYVLTSSGRALLPVLRELRKWGEEHG